MLALASGQAIAEEEHPLCKGASQIVGECFTVHGRLGLYNGIPLRIWIVGTHRVLSVHNADGSGIDGGWLPSKVRDLLVGMGEIVVFGDYEVCPLEQRHPGKMQPICVEDASRLVPKNLYSSGASQPEGGNKK